MKNLLNFKSLGAALSLLWMGASSSLGAYLPISTFDIAGGWRRDHIDSSFSRKPIITSIANGEDRAKDKITGECLDIWQIGFKGFLSPGFDECDCCLGWLNGFYVRGEAFWGWGDCGDFSHRIKFDPADLCDPVTSRIDRNRGDARDIRTNDWDVGAGYLFRCGCFSIGPVAGYSYHKLEFKARDVIGISTVNNPCFTEAGCFCDPNINQQLCSHTNPLSFVDERARFKSKWEGPWVGFDALWGGCDYRLYASYSYHWAHWHGSYHLAVPDLTDGLHFSNKRKGHDGHGHEGCIGANYTLCHCMDIGLGVSYKYYTVNAHVRPRAESPGSLESIDEFRRQGKTRWHSVAVTLALGYAF